MRDRQDRILVWRASGTTIVEVLSMSLVEAAFWVMVFLLILPVLLYPLALLILSRFHRTRRPLELPDDELPMVSVLIAARNEQDCIENRIRNLLEQDYPADRIEILIGSDASVDETDTRVEKLAQSSGRVRLIRSERRIGKPAIISRLVEEVASGEILVFTDADTVFGRETVRELVSSFSSPMTGCVDGSRRNSLESESCESSYWKYEKALKRLSSRMGAVLGATGAVFALRRPAYAPLNTQRGDDFELAVMARILGYRCVFNPRAVALEPSPDDTMQFSRMIRIVSWMTGSALTLLVRALRKGRPWLALQIFVHKLVRWQGGFMMAGATVASLMLASRGCYGIIAGILLAFHVLALVGAAVRHRLPSVLRMPFYFWLMYGASSIGTIRFLASRPVETWDRNAGNGQPNAEDL